MLPKLFNKFVSTTSIVFLLQKIFNILRINQQPRLKMYTAFGNSQHLVLYGHLFSLSPFPRKKYRDIPILNTLALLRLFFVKTIPFQEINVVWQGRVYQSTTEKDGFFKFEIPILEQLTPGEYEIVGYWVNRKGVRVESSTKVIIPQRNQFTFISDIDDTFLISYSSTIFKRLYVLFTENAFTRKPYANVVKHYNQLRLAQTSESNPNPFFYVSSSEWNLYDYIKDFVEKNNIPRGVFLLNQIKTLAQIVSTGKNNHNSKFFRIVRIIEAYPGQRFVLLGDDSQRDPYIYASVAKHFPNKVYAVYIRNVAKQKKPEVEAELSTIPNNETKVFYFKHSSEAMEHSKSIGLG